MKYIFLLVEFGIIAGIITDEWHGIEAGGNIAFAVIWLFAAITYVAVFCGGSVKRHKTREADYIITLARLSIGAVSLVLLAAGWFFTAFAYLSAWGLLWGASSHAHPKSAQVHQPPP